MVAFILMSADTERRVMILEDSSVPLYSEDCAQIDHLKRALESKIDESPESENN